MTGAEFRAAIKVLRQLEPLDKPVRVLRMAAFPTCWEARGDLMAAAYCWDAGSYYVIALDAASSNLRDDLAHEWAHLKSGTAGHKKRWLAAYGRCRQHFWPE